MPGRNIRVGCLLLLLWVFAAAAPGVAFANDADEQVQDGPIEGVDTTQPPGVRGNAQGRRHA